MTNNIEPICGVCGKPLVKSYEYHCDACEKLLGGIKIGECEDEGCGNIFSHHTYVDKLILSNFFDGEHNRKEKIKIWRSRCPRCRRTDKAFGGGKLAHWIGYGLEDGTTKELIHLALKETQTTKDFLKNKGIPEKLFLWGD